MKETDKRRAQFIAFFAAYFIAVWFLWYTPVVYPIKLFVVLLHEVSHGLVAVATGGAIQGIQLTPDQGGLCRCPGGDAFLTLTAGYLGSLLWGGLMFWGAQRLGRRAVWLTAAIGAIVLVVAVPFIRNGFGLAFGLASGLALIAAARWAGAEGNRLILTVLGLTSCLYAVLDIKSDILDRPQLLSDARLLAEMTAVPTVIWGMLWITAAIAFCWLLLRWAWKRV
jgi:hypothetical protein